MKRINSISKKPWFRNKGTILFVHGFSSEANSHEKVGNAIKKMGFRYYAIDFPGHGKTKYEKKSEMNLETYVDLTVKYIMENDLNNIILLGHSMGGAIAVCVNEAVPKRIKAIMLEDPLNKTIYSNPLKRLKENMTNPVDFKNSDASFIERIKFSWDKAIKGKGELSPLLMNLMNPLVINKISHAYEQIGDKPVLLMFGEYDRVIPPEQSIKYISSVASNLSTYIIKNAKHTPSHDNLDDYLKIIKDFLLKISKK